MPLDYRIGLKPRLQAGRNGRTDDHHFGISQAGHLFSPRNWRRRRLTSCTPAATRRFDLWSPLRPGERLQSKHGIEGPFLFYVGGSDFRKNLEFLIQGFAQIRDQGYEGLTGPGR